MTMLTIEENTPAWHDIRAKHVGGSEVAALLLKDRSELPEFHVSAFTLWQVKSGIIAPPHVDDEPGSLPWTGRLLEATIAQGAATLRQWNLIKGGYAICDGVPGPGGYASPTGIPGMGASIDYIATEPGPEELLLGFEGPGNIQIKNSMARSYRDKWTFDEPPYYILLQNQHEIRCLGYKWGCIVCYVDTGWKFFPYKRHDGSIRMIEYAVTDFWQSVRDKKPPVVDRSGSTAAALAAMYPTVEAERPFDLMGDNEMPEIAFSVLTKKASLDAAQDDYDEAYNRLREKMKGHKFGICQGYEIRGIHNRGSEGRVAKPGEIVGKRKPFLSFKVWEDIKQHAYGAPAAPATTSQPEEQQ